MIVALYLLFAVIHMTSSLNVDIPLGTYEFARGSNAVIPCKFQPAKPVNPKIIITWTGHPDLPTESEIEILTYFYYSTEDPQLDISSEFTDRASVQVDIAKGWVNLTLNSLKSQDSRVFQCKVKIPGDPTGKQSDVTNVVVLVAPSPPICAIQGKAEFYQNINLTCRSEEGMPEPAYKWQSYDVTNNPRPNPLKSTDVKGVLSLYNISAETSGYYICTSSNKIRSASCNLTLAVMPYSMNLGSTAAIAGGCAAALVLLVIIICCCCRHHRRKKAAEEYAMGSGEDDEDVNTEQRGLKEYQDKRVESKADVYDSNEKHSDHYDDQRDRDDRQGRPDNRKYDSERYDDERSDRHDDRRSDRYDDRRSDRSDDRRNDRYDDRRNDRYDDRRNDRYDDRRNDRYDDRRNDRYDDRRSDYDDRQNDGYNDRRRHDDRFDDRPDDHYSDRGRPPNVPANKPTRG